MNTETIILKIKSLVAHNRTEDAIEYLAKYHFSDIEKEIIILNNRYNKIREEERLGVITREVANQEYNTINVAIIDLLEKIENEGESTFNTIEKSPRTAARTPLASPTFGNRSTRPLLLGAIIIILVGGFALGYMFLNTSEQDKKTISTEVVEAPAQTDPTNSDEFDPPQPTKLIPPDSAEKMQPSKASEVFPPQRPAEPKPPVSKDESAIEPISFNATDGLILIYHSHSLARRDTFLIDAQQSVQYLKAALKRHYKITVPTAYAQRMSAGGYNITDRLVANHQSIGNEHQSLTAAGVKSFDLIEFDYVLYNEMPMSCLIRDVYIEIDSIQGDQVQFTLNGRTPTQMKRKEGEYEFYFDLIGECNPQSWIGKLTIDEQVYFIANPDNIPSTDKSLRLGFNYEDGRQ